MHNVCTVYALRAYNDRLGKWVSPDLLRRSVEVKLPDMVILPVPA